MKKSTIKKLLYQHVDSYEIVNVGYDVIGDKFELLLREFSLNGNEISYLNTFKKIVLLDKFGFCFYEDGVFHNTFEEQLNRIVLEDEILSFKSFPFSKFQKDWINILKSVDEFDEKEFSEYVFLEFKKQKENLTIK